METPQAIKAVAEFHKTFEHPVLDIPQIPALNRTRLRVALIAEELKELEEAVNKNDIVEVADALCDIQYVLAGAILEFGLAHKFKELFNEVQRSNMSKACVSSEEAAATVNYFMEKDNTECYIKESEGRYLVFRSSDNKVMKSVNYSPANLADILNK